MSTIEEALASIPGRRDTLNAIDTRLSDVIRHIEKVLNDLRPGVPSEVTYTADEGNFVLGFGKHDGAWCIGHGREDDELGNRDVRLLSAPRHVRAEVFTREDATQQTPIERLIIEVAVSLGQFAQERSPQVEEANRILAALKAAGFPDNG